MGHIVDLISARWMLRATQARAPSALVHALVLIFGVTYTRAVGNAVVSTTLILGDPSYRSTLLSNERIVGAGMTDILNKIPQAIVDFTDVSRGEGDDEIAIEASMIMGTPQVMSSEEAETKITQHLESNPLSGSVADLNIKLEAALGKPSGTASYVQIIGDTTVTAKPYSNDAKDNGWGIGGVVIEGVARLGSADYRTKLLAENRAATGSFFQQYINGIPGATTFGLVLNPNYMDDKAIDYIAEVTIDDAESNKAARDDTKFYVETAGLDVDALSSILGEIIGNPENGPEIVTGIEVTSLQAWNPADSPAHSTGDQSMAILSVALRLGSDTYKEMFFYPEDKAKVEARIRALINQIPTVSVLQGGVSIFKGYESDVVLYSVAIRVLNTTTDEQAKARVEQYIGSPGGRDIDGMNAQLVDALGLPPIEGTPYALGFEDAVVKIAKQGRDQGVDSNGRVAFFMLITMSSREDREAMLARSGETQQALRTAISDSFVPMETISAVNVRAGGVTMSAASNGTVIRAEAAFTLESAKSDQEARDSFRLLNRGVMSTYTHDILVKELHKLQGDDTLFSVSSVEITGVFTKKSYSDDGEGGPIVTVSAVLQNVKFDESDFNDKSRAYCAFEELYAQDLEAIVRQKCGCNPLAEIVRVTFGTNSAGGRRLLAQEVNVESNVHGADAQEVDSALKGQCAAGCTLGGSDAKAGTMLVEALEEESTAQGSRLYGISLALAALLAFMIG